MRRNNAQAAEASAATVGYEAQIWQMADALRGSMEAAKYKHVVDGASRTEDVLDRPCEYCASSKGNANFLQARVA